MSAAKKETTNDDIVYLQVPPKQILGRKVALSDMYVQLPNKKMIKIAKKGERIDVEQIERISQKSIDSLYVTHEDFKNVIGILLREVKGVDIRAGALPPQSAAAFEQYFQLSEAILMEIAMLPVTNESVLLSAQVTKDLSETFMKNQDLAKALKGIFTMADEVARHSVSTVMFANCIANNMKWKSPKLLEPISLGAFLHDIGLKELPKELVSKPRLEMTAEEVQLYETHPSRGVMLLKNIEGISNEVLMIVQQHHELPNGLGFPDHIRGSRMLPIVRVVALANALSHDVIDPIFKKGSTFSAMHILQRIDLVYKPMFGHELASAAKLIFEKPK
jgi:HD-GYP domain-containing protein (c-di-GMP phosphodiesterase class II)